MKKARHPEDDELTTKYAFMSRMLYYSCYPENEFTNKKSPILVFNTI